MVLSLWRSISECALEKQQRASRTSTTCTSQIEQLHRLLVWVMAACGFMFNFCRKQYERRPIQKEESCPSTFQTMRRLENEFGLYADVNSWRKPIINNSKPGKAKKWQANIVDNAAMFWSVCTSLLNFVSFLCIEHALSCLFLIGMQVVCKILRKGWKNPSWSGTLRSDYYVNNQKTTHTFQFDGAHSSVWDRMKDGDLNESAKRCEETATIFSKIEDLLDTSITRISIYRVLRSWECKSSSRRCLMQLQDQWSRSHCQSFCNASRTSLCKKDQNRSRRNL